MYLDNIDSFTLNEGGEYKSIYNSGKMSIINSNLNIQIHQSETCINVEIQNYFEQDNNVTDDFYLHLIGGLYNTSILEIENTTFNNSNTFERTNFISYWNHDEYIKDETPHTSGECDAKGGVNFNDKNKLTINNSNFINNKALNYGGVNYNNNGNITINNTKNIYNIANRGSVNYNLKSILTIENTNSTTKSSSINYNEKGIIKNRNIYETEQ